MHGKNGIKIEEIQDIVLNHVGITKIKSVYFRINELSKLRVIAADSIIILSLIAVLYDSDAFCLIIYAIYLNVIGNAIIFEQCSMQLVKVVLNVCMVAISVISITEYTLIKRKNDLTQLLSLKFLHNA